MKDVAFSALNNLRFQVILRFVDICGTVDHHFFSKIHMGTLCISNFKGKSSKFVRQKKIMKR
jgi:hypothetical protein